MIFFQYIKLLNYVCIYVRQIYVVKNERFGLENTSTTPKMGIFFPFFVLQLAFVFQGT